MSTGRPPGRPPKERPALVRADLLDAAARQLAHGYAAMSVRRLAAELGVSQSAVQHHARTKEALLEAVIDEVLVPQIAAAPAQTAAVTAARSAGSADAATLLRGLVRARLGAIAAHGGVVLAVLDDTSPGADRRRAYLLERLGPVRRQGLHALAGLAERGVSRPVGEATWSALITLAVPAIARSWARVQELQGSAVELERTLDELADLLVLGMLRR